MNKHELIEAVANKAGITKKMAASIIESLVAVITESLKSDREVTLTGFGTFRVSHRAARGGVSPRNPKERIQIPALKTPAFRAGKSLKDAIR